MSRARARAGIRVDRAVTELRRGRPISLRAGGEHILVAAIETMLPASWMELTARSEPLTVTLTAERAQASGWHDPVAITALPDAVSALPMPAVVSNGLATLTLAQVAPISLRLPAGFEPIRLADLAGIGLHGVDGSDRTGGSKEPAGSKEHAGSNGTDSHSGDRWNALLAIQPAPPAEQTTPAMRAALELARLARLVPAIVTLAQAPAGLTKGLGEDHDPLPDSRPNDDPDYLYVTAEDVLAYPVVRAGSLLRVSEAPVPLAGHENCRFVLFRETVADLEHVAIVIGDPDPLQPVLVRLHSSCLTGDLFASLRCDCGDQLRGAIGRLGESGGVLLYLAQEGRGIGLANKLRAYARQDAGLDTIDADRYLGFRGDERNFAVAVQMLRDLGIASIRLLTNNPSKIAALRHAGLAVVERLPIGGQVNRHNERYITTKRDRAGHLIDMSPPLERRASGRP